MKLGAGEPATVGPWRVEPVAVLIEVLWAAAGDPAPAGRPRTVAVDGRSGSGKTTLASLLLKAVPGAMVVHTDDIAWHQAFFDWAALMIEGVLRPAHEGRAVRYRPPAWDERAREGAIEISRGAPLLVIEGVGAARRELMPFIDAVVWVQSDLGQAQARGIRRDGDTQEARDFWFAWAAQEDPFLADQKPWQRASVVVCGTPAVAHGPDEVMMARP